MREYQHLVETSLNLRDIALNVIGLTFHLNNLSLDVSKRKLTTRNYSQSGHDFYFIVTMKIIVCLHTVLHELNDCFWDLLSVTFFLQLCFSVHSLMFYHLLLILRQYNTVGCKIIFFLDFCS